MKPEELEDLARAITEVDGLNPDEIYQPRGLKSTTPMWRVYGVDKAMRVNAIVERRRAARELDRQSVDQADLTSDS